MANAVLLEKAREKCQRLNLCRALRRKHEAVEDFEVGHIVRLSPDLLRVSCPAAPNSRGPRAEPCRHRILLWEWCLHSRRSRAGGYRPPPRDVCHGDRERALSLTPRI